MTSEKWINTGLNISLVFTIVPAVLFLFFLKKLPMEIPLYYSLPWGQAQIAPTPFLLILPAGSLVFLLINFILTKIFKDSPLLSLTFVWTSAAFSFLAFITLTRIILLVI